MYNIHKRVKDAPLLISSYSIIKYSPLSTPRSSQEALTLAERKENEQTPYECETTLRINRTKRFYALLLDQPEENSLCQSGKACSV